MPFERREFHEHEREQEHEFQHPAIMTSMDSSASPVFHTNRTRKILIAHHAKAGWITWAPHGASDEFYMWMLTYEPLINAIERRAHNDKLEDLRDEFHREAKHRFHIDKLAVAKAEHLLVEKVSFPFEVTEHEGGERVVRVPDIGRRRMIYL